VIEEGQAMEKYKDYGQNKLDFKEKCSTLDVWKKLLFRPSGT
jgi:hypothetical protein